MEAITQLDETQCRFCVITGGEPLLHIDAPLIKALHEKGYEIAVETNGTVALQKNCWDAESQQLLPPDWIACSPKLGQQHLALEYFDELKLVVPSYQPRDFQEFLLRQRKHLRSGQLVPLLWLQPEDGPRLKESIQLAVTLALQDPAWRVGAQTHKLLNVE
ncbi:7-carboxy-7-deazaguanine synthase [Cesiribacter andamanensis AMV16]|uniref:7-carboxy-7-deazaguanine synthase n=1 Tax=Cesiribacter andamanensis AMV16 TaxID=1279009 RepID=M7N228_9BACT|nr:7-carboxy-7-deazaguanine synthase [Cesiribacter andamanensis AMV16]